jgi:hypothetical protein
MSYQFRRVRYYDFFSLWSPNLFASFSFLSSSLLICFGTTYWSMIIVMAYALALVVCYPILGFTSWAVGQMSGLELTLDLPFCPIFFGVAPLLPSPVFSDFLMPSD